MVLQFHSTIHEPPLHPTYFRYVDDTFAILEKGKCLPFLKFYVERTDIGFEISVYRKPTFTGQYLRWESFSPLKRKISLISTLVYLDQMVCTKRRLNEKIERIKKIILDNGHPKNVINTQIAKKIAQFFTLKRFGPEKCPVHLRVPWISEPSTNLKKKSKPPWKAAMVPSALAWSLRQRACCKYLTRMFYLPLRKVLSYMNTSATVIVGT